MTAKTGAREDGGWRRNAAQVREWSRPARKKDWEGKVGVGGGVGCGRDGFGGGGVDNFVVQQQRTGTRGSPLGKVSGAKVGFWEERQAKRLSACPMPFEVQPSRSAADETRVWAHPIPIPFHPPPIAIPPPTHSGSPGPLQLASPPPVQHPAICGRVDVSIRLGLDNDIHADSATFDLARSWSVPASYSATPHPIPLRPFFTVPRRRVWRRRPGPRTAAMGAHQIAQRRAVQTTAAKAPQDGPDRNTHSHWWAAR